MWAACAALLLSIGCGLIVSLCLPFLIGFNIVVSVSILGAYIIYYLDKISKK